MKARLTLRPGQNGTKSLAGKHGDRLLAVRYRQDAATGQRFKTVELIEQILPSPAATHSAAPPPAVFPEAAQRPQADVLVRVDFGEVQLRERVRAAGGK